MTITSNNKSLNLNAIIKIIVFISQIDIDAGNYIMIKLFCFYFFYFVFHTAIANSNHSPHINYSKFRLGTSFGRGSCKQTINFFML